MNSNYERTVDQLLSEYRKRYPSLGKPAVDSNGIKLGAFLATIGLILSLVPQVAVAVTAASITLPFSYDFRVKGTLDEAGSEGLSWSPYWWVNSGARLILTNGIGQTIQGNLPESNSWRIKYAANKPAATDNGYHPQNVFQMFFRDKVLEGSASIYAMKTADNLSDSGNRHAWNGVSVLARRTDSNNYYYGGIRNDGGIVIKKKSGGIYQTLAYASLFPGTYNESQNPDLIPLNKWIGVKLDVQNDANGNAKLSLYTDVGKTGTWALKLSVTDDPAKYGPTLSNAGLVGIQSDYADVQYDDFKLASLGSSSSSSPIDTTTSGSGAGTSTSTSSTPTGGTGGVTTASNTSYDTVILGDKPVMYLQMASPSSGAEKDLSGRGNSGTYKGGSPTLAKLPNGDGAADFDGSSQYLTVPSSADLSIPTTHQLTWEAWIRPDVLQFPNASGDGYIDWMGKCDSYGPTCEWEARMYSASTPESRPNRISGYVFNPSAGLGSAADWQPQAGLLQAGQWLHVVAEYQTVSTPSNCNSAYPGTINIWVNGVLWNQSYHQPTGCMSQYSIKPTANNSSLNIGTMAFDTWFKGAVGKVAVYNYLLTPAQIASHFSAMTGASPSGSCADSCTIPVPTQSGTAPAASLAIATDPAPSSTNTVAMASTASTQQTNNLFSDSFSGYPNGLITNEFAFWNPTLNTAKVSPIWEMTSGSLFENGGAGWTGVPDDKAPDATSSSGNNSAVFRLTTKEADFGDVAVSFDLMNQGLTSTASTPPVDWDGVHIFLRYQSEYNLYYASINRRDNKVVIKKKVSGGSSNGGTYYDLSTYTPHTVPYSSWQKVKATVKNNADGSVTISLYADGALILTAKDDGSKGGAPITAPGKVGIRADNDNVKFKNFAVSAI